MAAFQVSGVVTVQGRPAANVVVSFAVATKLAPTVRRQAPAAVRTDKLGRFVQSGFSAGVSYVAAASSVGVTFAPAQMAVDAAHATARFEGTVATFAATGVVRVAAVIHGTGKPPGIPGVQISFMRTSGRLDLPVPTPVVTDATGVWHQHGFQVGASYNAAASKLGLGFSPTVAEVRADVSSEFTGSSSTFGASGRITTLGAAPDPLVTIQVTRISGNGAVPAATATDGAGAYSVTGLDRGSRYRITPLKPGATFDPPSHDVAFAPNSFPVVLASFTRVTNLVVTGQVLTTGGAGLVGAVITFIRTVGTGAIPRPVLTTSNGEYRAAGLDAGTTYVVTAARDDFSSAPTQLRATRSGTTTLNLTAFPVYEVSGKVVDLEPTDTDPQSLTDQPGVPGAIVSFHPSDPAGSAPPAVVSAADGTFHQRGFEVGPTFVAQAFAAGFGASQLGDILSVLGNLGGFIGGPFGGSASASPPLDLSQATFHNDHQAPLDNVFFFLQRTP
jgi:hypothetical protein